MTVSEFIDWLKTQDQGATVEVLKFQHGRGFDGGDYCYAVDFTAELSSYSDLSGNENVTPDHKRTLLLGEPS
jgi:hypothetical protein